MHRTGFGCFRCYYGHPHRKKSVCYLHQARTCLTVQLVKLKVVQTVILCFDLPLLIQKSYLFGTENFGHWLTAGLKRINTGVEWSVGVVVLGEITSAITQKWYNTTIFFILGPLHIICKPNLTVSKHGSGTHRNTTDRLRYMLQDKQYVYT